MIRLELFLFRWSINWVVVSSSEESLHSLPERKTFFRYQRKVLTKTAKLFMRLQVCDTLCTSSRGVWYPFDPENIFSRFIKEMDLFSFLIPLLIVVTFERRRTKPCDLARLKSRTRLGFWKLMEFYYIVPTSSNLFYEWVETFAVESLRKPTAHARRETSNARMHFWIPRQCLFYVFRFRFLCKDMLVMYWF